MRTVLNILNFFLGGFFTTLAWLFATVVSIVFIFTLPLTRSCWEITKLSLLPYGNEAVHVDELRPDSKNALFNSAGTLLNVLWLIFLVGGSVFPISPSALRNASQSLVFRWVLPILKLQRLLSGRWADASCRLKKPVLRVKPTPAAVIREQTA